MGESLPILNTVSQEEPVVQHQAGEREAADALRETMKKVHSYLSLVFTSSI